MANNKTNGSGDAALGFEQTLWAAADKLRGHLDSAEYKHVVLGLIFLKYISDAFQELHDDLAARQETAYTDPEDRDEYLAQNVFWVPKEARWRRLQDSAKSPEIGIFIDQAMAAIEKENPQLKGVLPQNYGREDLDKRRLGELIDLIGTIEPRRLRQPGPRCPRPGLRILPRPVRQRRGQERAANSTPRSSIVSLLVDMLEPKRGRIYDPCCGAGGMFVQSERFVEDHQAARRRHRHLRPGVQPHDLEALQDEPGHPRHRRQYRPLRRRHLPRRPAPRFESRLHPRQSRPSTSATGAASCWPRTSAGFTVSRRAATPTSPGCSI